MNHRTFLVALATVATLALFVGAVDDDGRPGDGPGADGRPRPHHHRFDGPPLSPERAAELMESIETERPRLHRHLTDLRRRDPRQFRRAMVGLDRFLRRLKDLPDELRQAVGEQRCSRLRRHHLVRQYHATADKGRRAELAAEIRELTGRIFDTDQSLREYKVRRLAEELKALREQLAARAAQRDTLIDRRVEELLAGDRPDHKPKP
ncbi:MAG: hypothetical protein ACOC7R_03785 [Planctomycetota bacterium]